MLTGIYVVVILLGSYVVITEILVPIIKGQQIFPSFRKNPTRIKLEAAREELALLKEETELLKELEQVNKQKQSLNSNEPT